MTFQRACPVSEVDSAVANNKLKKVVLEGVKILLTKSADDKIWAFDAVCTHEDKSLENAKWDAQNALLTCPFHSAVFSISQQGRAVSPPAVLPLKVYPTQIEIHNSEPMVMVDLDN